METYSPFTLQHEQSLNTNLRFDSRPEVRVLAIAANRCSIPSVSKIRGEAGFECWQAQLPETLGACNLHIKLNARSEILERLQYPRATQLSCAVRSWR